ncbi:MAG: NAD(P)-dependent alcohol dehydrogenase [Acidimicrobiaceae bacterium]|nr:NAD(P)-dependent alcohol dehydrogenase [Acidimicrobiaceae bacterium]
MNTRGYVAHAARNDLSPFEFDRRELRSHDVALDVLFAGICHSDIHQAREEWGASTFPMVPGHEIIGLVSAVGSDVTRFSVGQRIGVGVFVDSCRRCEHCLAGLQQYCSEGMTPTYNSYERDATTIAFGGYSNYFVIDEDFAVHVAETLDPAGAAPLLCAGITLYSPLRHWGAGPGKKVAIIGLGGLGHMGVQFAHAMGADTTVFSHSSSKAVDAAALGADHFVVTSDPEVLSHHAGRYDIIINATSADIDLNPYLKLLSLDGTLVIVGLSGIPVTINQGLLLAERRSLSGSQIGGMVELQEMMDFCGEHDITSQVEVISADYINQAWERTVASDVKYRFVIDASTF